MNSLPLAAVSAFTVSLLHTAIPSHWLCFVAVGKAQGWGRRQIMTIAALAGSVHVAVTVAIGLAVKALAGGLPEDLDLEHLSAFVLMGLGATYLVLHFLHVGHRHEDEPGRGPLPNAVAIGALMVSITLSPCSAAIPVLVAAATEGWGGAFLVGAVLLVTTVGMMLLLIGLTLLGIDRLQFKAFDRYEKLILGLVLGALGAAILAIPHGHAD